MTGASMPSVVLVWWTCMVLAPVLCGWCVGDKSGELLILSLPSMPVSWRHALLICRGRKGA